MAMFTFRCSPPGMHVRSYDYQPINDYSKKRGRPLEGFDEIDIVYKRPSKRAKTEHDLEVQYERAIADFHSECSRVRSIAIALSQENEGLRAQVTAAGAIQAEQATLRTKMEAEIIRLQHELSQKSQEANQLLFERNAACTALKNFEIRAREEFQQHRSQWQQQLDAAREAASGRVTDTKDVEMTTDQTVQVLVSSPVLEQPRSHDKHFETVQSPLMVEESSLGVSATVDNGLPPSPFARLPMPPDSSSETAIWSVHREENSTIAPIAIKTGKPNPMRPDRGQKGSRKDAPKPNHYGGVRKPQQYKASPVTKFQKTTAPSAAGNSRSSAILAQWLAHATRFDASVLENSNANDPAIEGLRNRIVDELEEIEFRKLREPCKPMTTAEHVTVRIVDTEALLRAIQLFRDGQYDELRMDDWVGHLLCSANRRTIAYFSDPVKDAQMVMATLQTDEFFGELDSRVLPPILSSNWDADALTDRMPEIKEHALMCLFAQLPEVQHDAAKCWMNRDSFKIFHQKFQKVRYGYAGCEEEESKAKLWDKTANVLASIPEFRNACVAWIRNEKSTGVYCWPPSFTDPYIEEVTSFQPEKVRARVNQDDDWYEEPADQQDMADLVKQMGRSDPCGSKEKELNAHLNQTSLY